MKNNVTRLANGLTVATTELPHMASVSVGLWVGVGGRHEPLALNGVSHFIEHMLFKGTRRRNAQQISQAVEGIGGYLNAFTTDDNSCFYAKARHDHFPIVLEVLMDMLLNSTFLPGEIEKEREVIKEELHMYLDQPHQHVQELLDQTLWPDHALGRPLTGTVKSLDALGRRRLIAYERENYVASTVIVAAAGHLRHAAVVKAVERYAKKFPEGQAARAEPFTSAQQAPCIKLFTKDAKQTQLALGVHTCSRHDERRHALRVLNAVLGENMSSRLFQVLREDRGLAYSINSSVDFYEDVGALAISAGVDSDKLEKSLRLIRGELRRLRETLPAPSELRRARDYLIGQIDLSMESTENQMMSLGEQLIDYGKTIPMTQIKRCLQEVTAAQVRAVARDFFTSDRMNLAVVGPRKGDRGLARLLEM